MQSSGVSDTTPPCRRHGRMIGLPSSQPQFAKAVFAASSPFRNSAYAEMTATKMSPDAELGRTAINSSNNQGSFIAQDSKLIQVLKELLSADE